MQPGSHIMMRAKLTLKGMSEAWQIPHFFHALWRNKFVDNGINNFFTYTCDGISNVLCFHQFITLLINHLTLIIGYIIVFKQNLAGVEVMRLHLTLSAFDLTCEQAALDGFAFTHTYP